ncbi:hypothetical protein [Chryseobacterium pennipullorum]|uniref:Uncharacterized protein n=1 Tax=Chryseobacterium pennipullorum TaxID=2258963 RepID=A0A3D9B6J3_9FLAO|nr:hypothetical protein [Chryseobacterium pennipullorum]REC48948.1 hypothetical protein DRF67_05160 [Chryseobacterium pennipullorum]
MNKLLLILGLLMSGSWISAQTFSDQTLQQSVLRLSEAKTDSDYNTLFDTFSGAGSSEKWKADYYAAVSMFLKTNYLLRNTPNTPLAAFNETAGKLALQAMGSKKNNGEINTLLGLITIQKIRIVASTDPKKDLKTAIGYMSKADAQLKNNPRLSFLKAEIAELSNNKIEAVEQHRKAAKEFAAADLSSETPNWGKQLIN